VKKRLVCFAFLLLLPACTTRRSAAIVERLKLVDSLILSGEEGIAKVGKQLEIDQKILRMLVENWSDVNKRDKTGRALLHYTARKGYKDLAEILLAKGANPN
jgi:ankyrin repeat protein